MPEIISHELIKILMAKTSGDTADPPIWGEYAVVMTSETALYANI